MTKKITKTNTKRKTMTKTKTKTKTFREHPQRETPETCDLGDILIKVMRRHDLAKIDKDKDKDI